MISVIIPTYNSEKKIKVTLDNILNQTCSEYEVIIVDDGSTDKTLEECKAYSIKHSNVRVIHTENRGSGPARNTGIKESKGQWLYFPDSDDEIRTDALEKLVHITQLTGCDTVVFGYKTVGTGKNDLSIKKYKDGVFEGESIRADYAKFYSMDAEYGIQGAPWNKLFSAKIVKENNIEYPPLRRHQDDGFISKYMQYAQKVVFSSEVLYTYYANSLQDVFRKYPVDYYKAVDGLYAIRKNTILKWNPDNMEIKRIVDDEFICNTIRSIELLFAPKCDWSYKKKQKWTFERCKSVPWSELCLDNTEKKKYQGMVIKLMKNCKSLVLPVLFLKVKLQMFLSS